MVKIFPQVFSDGFLKKIGEMLPAAMPALVGGGRSDVRVEVLMREIDAQVGAGPRRECLVAGIWLLAGELERCHQICQQVESAHGAAWHAAMHRQEGDFWNSKYWWRRSRGVRWDGIGALGDVVNGDFSPEVAGALGTPGAAYDPARFVDLVEAHKGDPSWEGILLDIQRWEWGALFVDTLKGGA